MYDLVIIGANLAGIVVARTAIQTKPSQRIALVCQGEQPQLMMEKLAGFPPSLTGLALATESWLAALSELAAAGIDVVPESGCFYPGLPPIFQTNTRQLQASRYLLAGGYSQEPSHWFGLAPADYLALDLFRLQSWDFSPQSWALIGATPASIALAQFLAQQGKTVYLLTRNSHLLPAEDQSLAHLLQVYLQVLGVTILSVPETQLQLHRDGKTIQVSHAQQTLAVEQVVRNGGHPQPQGLNLSALGLDFPTVTAQFQTYHPALYVCGPWLRGYALPALVLQESRWLASFLVEKKVSSLDYLALPYGIVSEPSWFRVGLTEAQAKDRYGQGIQIHYYTAPPKIEKGLQDTLKIIAGPSQQLLGAHWLGEGAPWGISLLALGYQQGWTLDTLRPHLALIEQEFQGFRSAT
ncbi:FAD-dependent oxidoreductase [Synechocystis sp. LKSZ1]|uniref:FAD-dependent oxidoreductase n=1 Tax=Synechocystis sp. LKSZ1 TaxID=3144951 RepID=UPI00336BE53E